MIQSQRLIDFFTESVQIPSPSFLEERYQHFLYNTLVKCSDQVILDKNPQGTNMIARIEGNPDKKGITLCAHMDTVETGLSPIRPVVDGNLIWSEGNTILGADNKATIAMFVEAIRCLKENNLEHRPVDLLFTFGEESHLVGIKELSTDLIRFKDVLLLDSTGRVGGVVMSSPTHYSFLVEVAGKNAHAGIEPELGENAIRNAARLILELPQGRLDDFTTFNLGEIRGGQATNIVPDRVNIKGEFRSLKKEKIQELLELLNTLGMEHEGLKVEMVQNYLGYQLEKDNPLIQETLTAMDKCNIEPSFVDGGGGSDANILRQNGFNAVNLTSGMQQPHTPEEHIYVDDLIQGTELIMSILQG